MSISRHNSQEGLSGNSLAWDVSQRGKGYNVSACSTRALSALLQFHSLTQFPVVKVENCWKKEFQTLPSIDYSRLRQAWATGDLTQQQQQQHTNKTNNNQTKNKTKKKHLSAETTFHGIYLTWPSSPECCSRRNNPGGRETRPRDCQKGEIPTSYSPLPRYQTGNCFAHCIYRPHR